MDAIISTNTVATLLEDGVVIKQLAQYPDQPSAEMVVTLDFNQSERLRLALEAFERKFNQ